MTLYEKTLEDILRYTGGRRMLKKKEAARYLGMSEDTLKKRFGIGKGGVTAMQLAAVLSDADSE